MKDSEFMELLNLYIDQQIDPADATRMEEEILRNPSRRRTYREYCRMHRACVVWSEQSVANEPAAAAFTRAAVPAHGFNLLKFLSWTGGLAAAAACVALVFVGRSKPASGQAANPAGDQIVQIDPVATPAKGLQLAGYRVDVAAPQGAGRSDNLAPVAAPQTIPDTLYWLANFQLEKIDRLTPAKLAETRTGARAGQNVFTGPSAVEAPAAESISFQFSK